MTDKLARLPRYDGIYGNLHAVTVGELVDALSEAIASGEVSRDAPVFTEGSITVGRCSGAALDQDGSIVLTRHPHDS